MKFIKRLALDSKNQTNNRFAVEADDTIITTSKVSLQLPSGTSADRPSPLVNGQIRYSTTVNDTEIYNVGGDGLGWEKVLTNRQHTITAQNLGVGNYINTVFGPLSYDVSTSKPQNVLVFVDNVYQIPNTNYNLIPGNSFLTTATNVEIVDNNTTTIVLNTTTNIVIGELVTAASGIQAGTTVTDITTATNTIEISLPTNDTLATGTIISFSFQSGVFIEFTSAVPAKQVFALLGFDGYSP